MSTATSELLRAAYMGRLPDPCRTVRELQALAGYSDTDAARALGVSPHTFRRWRRDRPPKPTAVRLLAIHAGYVPWPGWRGWEVHDGLLFPPDESYGLGPEQVATVRFLLTLARNP